MIVTLHTQGLKMLAQVQAFVSSNSAISFTLTNRVVAYNWMSDTLKQFHYARCTRTEKGVLRLYLRQVHANAASRPDAVYKTGSRGLLIGRGRKRAILPSLISD
jgi:hypothetical protein